MVIGDTVQYLSLKLQLGEWANTLLLVVVYFVYLQCGAGIFYLYEYFQVLRIRRIDCENTSSYVMITDQILNSGYSKEVLQHVAEKFSFAYEYPFIDAVMNETEIIWDFYNALSFSTCLVTTLGYGHISPKTPGGFLFCVLYALFGITLNDTFIRLTAEKYCGYWDKKLDDPIVKALRSKISIDLYYVMCFIYWTIYVFMLSAILFMFTENWSLIVGLYYTFISFSTVGFGDFVAGQSLPQNFAYGIYRLFLLLWIIFGIPYINMIFCYMAHKYASYFLHPKVQKSDKVREVEGPSRLPQSVLNIIDTIEYDCHIKVQQLELKRNQLLHHRNILCLEV